MKKVISLTLLFLSLVSLHAQFKEIAVSPGFDEPNSGQLKLLLMKNGSLAYVRVSIKHNIDIRIYDSLKQEKAVTNIIPSFEVLKTGSVEGCFEINGDIVLLISEIKKTPYLHRFIIDGNTGQLKKEEKIEELQKLRWIQGYALLYGDNMKLPDFFASKDQDSENYAVALFNSFESERSKRIEIILFGSDHQIISRGYYASPEEKYKYLEFVSMAVIGNDKVSVLVNGYNTASHGGKHSEVILANLDKGSSAVSFNELNFPKDKYLESGIIKYNPSTKQIVVVAKMREDKETLAANIYIGFVNPFTRKSENFIEAGISESIFEKGRLLYGNKYKFLGAPESIQFNEDGSFWVLYHEIIPTYRQSINGVSYYTKSMDIVIAAYNKNGVLTDNYLIPKNHYIMGSFNIQSYTKDLNNQYKQITWFKGNDKTYLILNDTELNIDQIKQNKSPLEVMAISTYDAFYFELTGKDVIPERKYLFGRSPNEKEHKLSQPGLSVYDKKNNLFITLRLQKEGKIKTSNIVWLEPK